MVNRQDIVKMYLEYMSKRLSYLFLNISDGPTLSDRDYLLVCMIEELCESSSAVDIFTFGELTDLYGAFSLLTIQEKGCVYKIKPLNLNLTSDTIISDICGLLRHKQNVDLDIILKSMYEWICGIFSLIADHFGMDCYDLGYLVMCVNMTKLIGRDLRYLPILADKYELEKLMDKVVIFERQLLSHLKKDNPLNRLLLMNELLFKGEKVW